MRRRPRMIGMILLITVIVLVIAYAALWLLRFDRVAPIYGVTFSAPYAQALGLDPQETLRAILDDLKPQRLRLVTYWNEIERASSTYDFSPLDWQLEEASARHIPVVLAVGYRTPRWPECHIPAWLPQQDTGAQEFRSALFAYLTAAIERYRDHSDITTWQVENEPLLSVFGECPPPDIALLKEEIALVHQLDPTRPVLVTDSGELGFFPRAAGLGDIFGTTLYRYIWNEHVGSFTHIYPPAFYALRAWLTKRFSSTQDVVIAELQGEPWSIGNRFLGDIPFDEQTQKFGAPELQSIVNFARRTGIRETYLWGAEWWYYRKTNGDTSFWDTGEHIFAGR